MYDSVTLYSDTKQRISEKFLKNITVLKNLKTDEEFTTSELNNMRIKQTCHGIFIKGSLSKYVLGNNIYTLTRGKTKEAIDKIQDELSINLNDFNVYKMEIADNFKLNEPYKNYLNFLIDCPYLKKSYFDDSIYFSNKQRQLVFYDKPKEMRSKKILLPKEFKQFEHKTLRYEVRFRKNLREQLKKEVKIRDLYEKDFYSDIINKWKSDYFSINKLQRIMLDNKAYTTPKTYKDYLLLQFINEKGIDSVLNDIDANRVGFKSTVGASRCKRAIKNLVKHRDYSEPNALIDELDSKVREAAEYHIQS